MAGFISDHNLSFTIMDHFSDLLPQLCPDSKIASQFKSKRTKTKCIVRNALAPHFHQEVVQKLQISLFSIIIDGITDITMTKELAVVTRVYNGESMKIDCRLYDLLEVSHCDAGIYQALIGLFDRDGIPLNNIIGFAVDTTNDMFREHNSVVSHLKERIPEIFLISSHSAKRQVEFRVIQHFTEVEPQKLLCPCQT